MVTNQAITAAEQATKATIEGARALADELGALETPQEQYEKFQHEVMPGVAAGFVDQLELYALVLGNEVRVSGADFTLVSTYRPGVPLFATVRASLPATFARGDIQQLRIKSKRGSARRLPGDRQQRDVPLRHADVRARPAR